MSRYTGETVSTFGYYLQSVAGALDHSGIDLIKALNLPVNFQQLKIKNSRCFPFLSNINIINRMILDCIFVICRDL